MKRITLIGASALLLAGCCNNYSVVILGDTHFDTYPVEKYHANYNEPVEWLNNVQRAEFERNAQMWEDRCPRLLDRAAKLTRKDTRMIFQTGDLIQGDCGTADIHRLMLSDVMSDFKKYFSPGIPFVTVAGNHDVRGNYMVDGTYNRWGDGAEKVYDNYMPARMAQELGIEVPGTTYTFRIGRDAYIAVDFNSPDDAAIEQALKDAADARNIFVLCHAPVFPYSEGSVRWIFHGGDTPSENAARRHFLELFAQRNVIWLCGHTHNTEFMDWYGHEGRITQMTMNSVWASDNLAEYSQVFSSAKEYGSIGKETELFAEYQPGTAAFSLSRAAGSYLMTVRGRHVTVDFYAGDSEKVTKRFVLR